MPNRQHLLNVEGVTVRYGGIEALRSVSLNVEAGEILGVIGPNGSGKTTLLDCICGFIRPTNGRIRMQGTVLNSLPAFSRARSGVRRIFQNTALFEGLSVLENVMIGADHRTDGGRSNRPSFEAANAIMDQIGLTEFARVLVGVLSTGYRKRVEIARALAGEPRLLLLDEPTAGIQPADASAIMTLVERLSREAGLGVVLIEHNMPVLMSHSDRVIALDLGEIIAEGPPEIVQRDEHVQASYLGGVA